MSRTASHGRDALATDQDQDRDDGPDGISLGAYREDELLISGTYLPERGTVAVEGIESNDVVEVSLPTWLDRSEGKMIDRVARQRRALVRDGDLLDHPECADLDCVCRLTPLEIECSEEAGQTDDLRCRTCLSECFADSEIPPWVSPEDRTVDRSVVETVSRTELAVSQSD